MDKEQALNLIKQIANQIYEQGTVSLAPKAHQALVEAIGVLEKLEEPKEVKK